MMKRGILLATAAALAAAGLASAEGEDNGGKPFAATARFEEVWPAAGFDYTFAKRVALGPVLKYDGESYAAGVASRIYILNDSGAVGVNPYVAAEGGYLHDTETIRYQGYWTYGFEWVNTRYYTEIYDCGYGFVGGGVDLRTPKLGLVPFAEIGPRREFRESDEALYLYWALGFRYTW
ncbi:MAG: hypothetical protein JSU81_01285 [Candidatus Coatesbacteria bacterium]|nr:MAG: hypothetical protein JSU81_01285 [Candidatus Coatesbacteria bacterium]